MFEEIEINEQKIKAFFDMENMRFYIEQNWEENGFADKNKTKIVKISNNIICIDTSCNYMGTWNDTKYYTVLYYFNFQTLEYTDGIKKVHYFSDIVDGFLLPHVKFKEKIKEDKKTIKIENNNQEIKLIINRRNYIEKYYDDLNKKSFIECEFDNTDNWENIYNLCMMIEEYLRVTLYIKYIDKPIIKIFNEDNIEMGELVINKSFYKCNKLYWGIGKYEGAIERNTEKIFKFLCNNPKLNLSNIREYDDFNRTFNSKRIYDLYSAFEVESNKIYKRKEANIKQENIKNKIISLSRELKEYKSNKEFIEGLINNRIRDYGIGYGHKERLRKAISDYINLIPARAKFYNMNDNIKEIIDTVYRLRTEIIHDNFIADLSHEENVYLEYFEWIVYTMQLKRMGISNDDIEEILDLTFGVG